LALLKQTICGLNPTIYNYKKCLLCIFTQTHHPAMQRSKTTIYQNLLKKQIKKDGVLYDLLQYSISYSDYFSDKNN